MQNINTLSLTHTVNNWLANTRHPRILHIFNGACNLINENKDVLSIVTPQIGSGPFNMVVEGDIRFSEYIDLMSPVSGSSHLLNLGTLAIHTTDAKLWNPRPDWEKIHAHKNNIFKRLTMLPIANYQSPIFDLQFSKSLIFNDIPAAKKLVSQLAGLGIGLTPSGDDFLMGALHAAWIIHPPEVASVLAKEIAETAAPLTTSLSAAWIRSTGRGEAGILWHEFFAALILHSSDLQFPISKILAVGETSGTDALSGFFSAFIACKERIIGEWPS